MTVTIAAALIRHLLTIAGVTGTLVSDGQITQMVSAATVLGSAAWSIYQKVAAERAKAQLADLNK
jgi:ABC-type uncharacterized transport system permease subunit